MSMQVSHAYYAERYLDLTRSSRNYAAFMSGVLFPDCRQMSSDISRSLTHLNGATLGDVSGEISDFRAGMLLHEWTDMTRVEYLIRGGMDENADGIVRAAANKMAEDALLYGRVSDWSLVISSLDDVFDEEMAIIEPSLVERWHRLLQTYFRQLPDAKSLREFASQLPTINMDGYDEILAKWSKTLSDPAVCTLIVGYEKEFERLVARHD